MPTGLWAAQANGGVILAELLLRLEQLSCERDERPLFSGLDLSLHGGDLVQVLGPNGSGKTTLLRALAGVSEPAHGRLLWREEPMSRARWAYRQALLYIGHSPGVKAALTPLENLDWYRALSGGSQRDEGRAALAQVGLEGYEDIPCFQLSAGQLRRVALARLYLSTAPLWILDEPFTAIDQSGVAALEERLQAQAEAGGAVILTSHQEVRLPGLRRLNLCDYPPVDPFMDEAGEGDHVPTS